MKPGITLFSPENLLPDHPSVPAATVTLDTGDSIEAIWNDAAGLVVLAKNLARATTATKALCGLRLRFLREHYFGPRNPNGGRPKKTGKITGFSWGSLLAEKLGINEETAKVWMRLADAVELLAEREGISLRETCEKLPWNWTPEEAQLMESTVQKLTGDKTQRQLLQSMQQGDFLSDIGYVEPERINGSNNQLGINGGKKQPAASAHERVEGLRCLARTSLFGHDTKDHRPKFGSPAYYMNALVDSDIKEELHKHPAASLIRKELADIYEVLVQPFTAAFRKLAGL